MSLAAIQDNLVKTSLVQQTQARGEDVARTQDVAQILSQKEHDRQEDQVVISTRHAEQEGVRPDAERRKDERRRKRRDGEKPEDGEEEGADDAAPAARAAMRRINIVI